MNQYSNINTLNLIKQNKKLSFIHEFHNKIKFEKILLSFTENGRNT